MAATLGLIVALGASGQQARIQIAQFGDEEQAPDPGFILMLAEENIQKQVDAFHGHLDRGEWGDAFRVLTELEQVRIDGMVQVGEQGLYRGVRPQMQSRVLALPPEGRRAYRLYFDGQAEELYDAVIGHPRPGSDQQLALAQRLVDRQLASSVGGDGADLLGDLYYERGSFAQAWRAWRLALDYGSPASDKALRLEAKMALALLRSGETEQAAELYEQLAVRYGGAGAVEIAGGKTDLLQLLGDSLNKQGESGSLAEKQLEDRPLVLPKPGAEPAWRLTFLNQAMREQATAQFQRQNGFHRTPRDIIRFIPPAAADNDRVYVHWLGVVFALDRATGRIRWQHNLVGPVVDKIGYRDDTNAGDPRNYHIALADQMLLVTTATPSNQNTVVFSLLGFDKRNGNLLWQSRGHPEWSGKGTGSPARATSLLGEVLVDGRRAYAVMREEPGSDCYLRRFDPRTGEVDWTIPLGVADPVTFQYTVVRRMPQPKMTLNDGMLYIQMNPGALIAVDVSAQEIAWARPLPCPDLYGANDRGIVRHSREENVSNEPNPNGSGGLILSGGLLFAKQHYDDRLYAVDAVTGSLRWERGGLVPWGRLAGADDERVYVKDSVLHGFSTDGLESEAWPLPGSSLTLAQDEALSAPGQLLTMQAHGLCLFDTAKKKFVQEYVQNDYLGSEGGRLYRFGDLLVIIDRARITALRLGRQETDPPTP